MSCFCGHFRPSRGRQDLLITKALVEAEALGSIASIPSDNDSYDVPIEAVKNGLVDASSPLLSPDHMSGSTATGLMNDFSLNDSFLTTDPSDLPVDVWAIAYSLVSDLVDSIAAEAISPLMSPDLVSDTASLLNETLLVESLMTSELPCPAVGQWSTGYSIVNITPLADTNCFTADWGSHVLTGRTEGLNIPEAKLGETGISLSGDISPNLKNLKWCNGQGWSRIEN